MNTASGKTLYAACKAYTQRANGLIITPLLLTFVKSRKLNLASRFPYLPPSEFKRADKGHDQTVESNKTNNQIF